MSMFVVCICMIGIVLARAAFHTVAAEKLPVCLYKWLPFCAESPTSKFGI